MTKTIKIFIIFGLLSLIIACNAQGDTTSEIVTSAIEATDSLTTNIPETTDTQTTTEVPTTTDNITEDTTSEATTIETTTSVPTTTEVTTTNQPTTETTTSIPTTTEVTTTEATTIELVTIYFENVNAATSINTLSNRPGNTFTMPDDPIRSGYIFEGWFEDDAFTIPFNITVYPENDMTVYAKWIVEVTTIDEMVQVLEDEFNFSCSANVCVLQESITTYTFNLNNITFTKQLLDDDTTGDEQTKNEMVVIDEDWNVSYSISIVYLATQTANLTVTGNGLTGSYNINSFSSNYLSQSNLYDDAVQFIDGPYGAGAVGFLELILETADISLEDLAN